MSYSISVSTPPPVPDYDGPSSVGPHQAWSDGEAAARAGQEFWMNPHYYGSGSPYCGDSWFAGWCAEKKRIYEEAQAQLARRATDQLPSVPLDLRGVGDT